MERLRNLEDIERTCNIVRTIFKIDDLESYRLLPDGKGTPSAMYWKRANHGRCNITFYQSFIDEESPNAQRRIIVHEHIHHVMRQLRQTHVVFAEDLAADLKSIYDVLICTADEMVTEKLEQIIYELIKDQLT